MESLPDLAQCSEQEKEALIVALWAEVQRLRARLAAFEAKQQEPVKDAHNSSVPPSRTHKTNVPPGSHPGTHRAASVGRAGGGRSLHPDPDHVIIAKAKSCPHCGHGVQQAHQQRDCQFALEAGDTVFAPRMKALLLRAFAMHKRRDRLAASTLSQYRGDLRRRLARCLALEPETTQGQRLKKRYTAIQNNLF